MATATFKPAARNTDDVSKLTVGEELIAATIVQAQSALWRAELSRCLLKLVIASMAVTLAWVAIDQWIWSPGWPVRLLVLTSAIGAVAWWIATRVAPLMRSRIRADYAAQSLELDMPDLRHQLSSYVSLRDDLEAQGVRGAVVRSIGARAAGQIKQHRIDVPSEASGTFTWWIVMAVMLAVVAAYTLLSPKNTLQSAQRLLMPFAAIDAPSRVTISDVLPGDAEVLSDRPVAISAAILGLSGKDEPVVAYGVGFSEQAALVYDASTDRFVANVSVPSSTAYQLLAGDAVAGPFRIKTRDVPVASVRQVEIVPPKYTGLPKRISTGGAISGEENARVTIATVINRAITRARIEFNPREGGQATAAASKIGPSAGAVDMTVAENGLSATVDILLRLPREKSAALPLESYRIRVWDADGNENPDPITYPVRIIRDLPPEVTMVQPRELTKELPINAQQLIEIAATDPDYGLRRVELVWQRGADEPQTEILWSAEQGERGNRVAEYRFRPEKLGLRVGDRVQVSAAALDNREDAVGNYEPNRTVSQPVDWVIVEPRQLPPPNAPEDGVSESDGEPASSGEAESKSDDQGGENSGDGQSDAGQSGSSAGADGKDEGQQGKSDGQGSESGDASADDSAGADKPSPENRSESVGEPVGDAEPNRGQAGDRQSAEQAAGDSAAQADSQQNGDRQPQDGQPGSEQPASDQSQGEGGDGGQPPQHDGDAFEKIRDYLNKKRAEAGQQSQPSAQESNDQQQQPTDPQAGDADAGDMDASGKQDRSGENEKMDPSGQGGESGDAAPNGNNDPPTGDDPPSGDPAPNGDPAPDGDTSADGKTADSQSGKSGQPQGEPDSAKAGAAKPDQKGSAGDANQPSDPADSGSAGKPEGGEPGKTGEGPQGDSETGSGDSSDRRPDDQRPSDQKPVDAKANGGDMPGAAGSDGKPDPSRPADDNRPEASSAQSSGGGVGDGNASGTGGADGEGALPPEPVDVEYARKATDLVLDYLDQNRDTPDPELLDRLNWTPAELNDFTDRWKQLLKSQQDGLPGNAGDAKQVEDTLRSLGIRPPATGPIGESRDRADTLRNLRDSGNRPAAPSIYRDAFEAFRRGVNR